MTDNAENQRKAQEALSGKKDFARQLRAALATHAGGSDSEAYFRGLLMAATVLVQEAIDGRQPWAVQELINRIDGKVAQAVDVSGRVEMNYDDALLKLLQGVAADVGTTETVDAASPSATTH
jgi:hypothetical protein